MSINLATQRLIDNGPSTTVELVASPTDVTRIAAATCALLNANGGTVIAGVDERGLDDPEFQHRSATEEDADRLRHFLYEQVSPNSVMSISIDETQYGPVLVIDVPNGRDTPYTFDGRVYLRSGKSVKAADSQAIREMVLEKGTDVQRWERRPSPTLTTKDLDRKLIEATVKRGRENRGFVFENPRDLDAVLQQLEVAEFGQLTNAADVVFGRNVAQRLPQIRVRAVRFESDRSGDFIDDQLLEGPALALLDDMLAFVRRHVPVTAKFEPSKAIRQDVPQFPFEALREGIVNALVHRDYASFSGSVKISIYPDRLEIWNNGRLPDGLTAKKLEMAQHESILINPDISHVFYLYGQMERVGRGTYNMVRYCRAFGMRTPTWKNKNQGVLLTFHGARSDLRSELNERQLALIDALRAGAELLTTDYSERFAQDVTDRTARRDLEKLEDFGFLERSGAGRGTIFVRTDKVLN